MAQLVEHIVHIDGVTGSSPVATTETLFGRTAFFLLQNRVNIDGARSRSAASGGSSEAEVWQAKEYGKRERRQTTIASLTERSESTGPSPVATTETLFGRTAFFFCKTK